MQPLDHRFHNKRAWDKLAKSGNRFAKPADDKDFIAPLASVDGPGWLGESIDGKNVLCLAAGGGRQGPVYAATGAHVTVVDISPEMLEIDRHVAQQKQLSLRTIETTMEDLSMIENDSFDIVIQPVSTCYVPDVRPVFDEVARVTRADGIYISQHKQPASLQSSIQPGRDGYFWTAITNPQRPLPSVKTTNLVREPGTIEFSHSWQSLIGEMCRAGFLIADLIEPDHADLSAAPGSFEHRSCFIPPYVRVLAKRTQHPAREPHRIWTE